MFWGLIMEPHKRYTQIVEKSFHVSMASLDVSTAGAYNGAVQVMINYENRNYLLCTLQKGTTLQVPLDLNFQEGTKIAFTSNGSGHVHLTGYLVPEEDDLDDELEEEEEDDDDVPQLVGKQSKRKALDALSQSLNNVKRSKHDAEEEDSDEDDDDEDDSDLEEEFKDETLDEDDDEDEEAEDEEDEDEEEEEEVVKQPAKKTKQIKKEENKKQEKQKLVNGKDAKHEQKPQDIKQEKKNKGEQQAQTNKQEQKKRVIEGGVQIEDLKVGTGAPAKSGKFISVYYVGRLKNGKKFDSCNQGEGFKFRLGKKEVIQGWDVGISGMKIGGKRRITIPPALAYGAKGSPPVIPPNSVLVFEVELKNVH